VLIVDIDVWRVQAIPGYEGCERFIAHPGEYYLSNGVNNKRHKERVYYVIQIQQSRYRCQIATWKMNLKVGKASNSPEKMERHSFLVALS